MRVIWDHRRLSAAQVTERLMKNDPSWHPKTVRTLLGRLLQKKALKYEAQGRAYLYEPAVSESECVASASESFLDRVFGGSLKPMLAHFVEQQKLTRKDLQELNDLLERGTQKSSKAGRKTWKQ